MLCRLFSWLFSAFSVHFISMQRRFFSSLRARFAMLSRSILRSTLLPLYVAHQSFAVSILLFALLVLC